MKILWSVLLHRATIISTENLSINQDILQVWKMQVWKTQVRMYMDGIRKYRKHKYEFDTVEKTPTEHIRTE